jgi:hypothetical protein
MTATPCICLPAQCDDILGDRFWRVVHVGHIQPARTSGETGLYDFQAQVVSDFTTRPEQEMNERRSVTLPIDLLSSFTVGSIWHGGERIAQQIPERRSIRACIGDDFQCVDGEELIERHALRANQRLSWAVELQHWPLLVQLGGREFLDSKFVQVRHSFTDDRPPFYYVPCVVLFRDMYFGSSAVAKHILSGEFEGKRNQLYCETRSGWVDRPGGTFEIDTFGRHSQAAAATIALLACHRRGRRCMELLRASVQQGTSTNQPIRIAADWPVAGTPAIAFWTERLPYAKDDVFIVTRISRVKGTLPFSDIRVIDYKASERPDNQQPTPPGYDAARAPSISSEPTLKPNTQDEGKSNQRPATVYQDDMKPAWFSKKGLKITRAMVSSKEPRAMARPDETEPIKNSEYSPAPKGSSKRGIPRAVLIPNHRAEDLAIIDQFSTSDDRVGVRFAQIIHVLIKKECFVRLTPMPDPMFVAQLVRDNPWLGLKGADGTIRARRLYHAWVAPRSWREPTWFALLFAYERADAEGRPHDFHVVDDVAVDDVNRLRRCVASVVANTGRLPKSSDTLQSHTIRDQRYDGEHGSDRSAWHRKGWGKSWEQHHAFKVWGACRSLYRERSDRGDMLNDARRSNAV